MLDELKEEGIVNKVGGRFKLSTLIQKRMVALNTGARPLVDVKSGDRMTIVIQEILQDKIFLDQSGNLQTRGAGPDQRMYLVDEKYRVGVVDELFQHRLQALLEITPVFRACQKRPHVERVDVATLEDVGHFTLDDAARETLRNRRLAHTRLAHQQRVVLAAPAEHLDHPLELEPQRHNAEPEEVLRHIRAVDKPGIFALPAFHPFLGEPVKVRLLKDIALAARGLTVLLIGHHLEVPHELVGFTARFALRLPGPADRRAIVERCAAEYTEQSGRTAKIDDGALDLLVQNLAGLTHADTERLARNAIRDDGAITNGDLPAVMKAKYQLLNRGGVLSFEYETARLDDLAGFRNLKSWLEQRVSAFGAARPPELDPPKGILLLGVQGCGKSLAAKATAGAFGIPLLRLDFGESIFLGMPVTEALWQRAEPTMLLTLYALTIQIIIGVSMGVLAAVKHNTFIDRGLMVFAISGAANCNPDSISMRRSSMRRASRPSSSGTRERPWIWGPGWPPASSIAVGAMSRASTSSSNVEPAGMAGGYRTRNGVRMPSS